MSKRQRESDDLFEQLKLVRNDPLRVQQILDSQDIATVAGIVTSLLNATISDAPRNAKHQKKAHNRPRMPNELFVEMMLFMDRDSLDSMQLACRFMLDYIREHETTELALRQISKACLGDVYNPDDEAYWLPVARIYRSSGCEHGNELVFNCVHGLLPYLRLAYCEEVEVRLERIQSSTCAESFEIACGMLFNDLNARETDVEALGVFCDQGTADLLSRSINAFKSVKRLIMWTKSDELIEPEAFNEAFFASLAHRGVRYFNSCQDDGEDYLDFLEVDASAALAYAFASPTADVSRELSGLQCNIDNDFLQLVKKKASELDIRQRVDLEAAIGLRFPDIDSTGFEKYERGEGKWVVNDLDNGLKLEIEARTDRSTVYIHVYSSP